MSISEARELIQSAILEIEADVLDTISGLAIMRITNGVVNALIAKDALLDEPESADLEALFTHFSPEEKQLRADIRKAGGAEAWASKTLASIGNVNKD